MLFIAMIAFGPSSLFSFASAENSFSCSDPIPGDEARRTMCSVVESTVMVVDGCEFPCLAAQGCTVPEKYDCEQSTALTAPTWNSQECDDWQDGSGKCSANTGCPQCTPKVCTCSDSGEFLDEESRAYDSGTVPVCKKCPAGYFVSATGDALQHNAECQACAPGTFQNETGESACKNCDAGSVTDTLEQEGASSCNECFPGMFSASARQACEECAGGRVASESGVTTCEECSSGKHSSTGVRCEMCAAGTFSAEAGSHECTICPGGYYQENEDANDCVQCGVGSALSSPQPNTAEAHDSKNDCKECKGTTKSNGKRDAECSVCGAEGKFDKLQDSGERACSTCATCPAGYSLYKDDNTLSCSGTNAGQCTACKEGYFKSSGDRTRLCTRCTGACKPCTVLGEDCEWCETGASNAGEAGLWSTQCEKCPEGKRSSADGTACEMCSTDDDAVTDEQCLACPIPGEFLDEGRTTCQKVTDVVLGGDLGNHETASITWNDQDLDATAGGTSRTVRLCPLQYSVESVHSKCNDDSMTTVGTMHKGVPEWADCAKMADADGSVLFNHNAARQECETLAGTKCVSYPSVAGWFSGTVQPWAQGCGEPKGVLASKTDVAHDTTQLTFLVNHRDDLNASMYKDACIKDNTYVKARVGIKGTADAPLDSKLYGFSDGTDILVGNTGPTVANRSKISILPLKIYPTSPIVACSVPAEPDRRRRSLNTGNTSASAPAVTAPAAQAVSTNGVFLDPDTSDEGRTRYASFAVQRGSVSSSAPVRDGAATLRKNKAISDFIVNFLAGGSLEPFGEGIKDLFPGDLAHLAHSKFPDNTRHHAANLRTFVETSLADENAISDSEMITLANKVKMESAAMWNEFGEDDDVSSWGRRNDHGILRPFVDKFRCAVTVHDECEASHSIAGKPDTEVTVSPLELDAPGVIDGKFAGPVETPVEISGAGFLKGREDYVCEWSQPSFSDSYHRQTSPGTGNSFSAVDCTKPKWYGAAGTTELTLSGPVLEYQGCYDLPKLVEKIQEISDETYNLKVAEDPTSTSTKVKYSVGIFNHTLPTGKLIRGHHSGLASCQAAASAADQTAGVFALQSGEIRTEVKHKSWEYCTTEYATWIPGVCVGDTAKGKAECGAAVKFVEAACDITSGGREHNEANCTAAPSIWNATHSKCSNALYNESESCVTTGVWIPSKCSDDSGRDKSSCTHPLGSWKAGKCDDNSTRSEFTCQNVETCSDTEEVLADFWRGCTYVGTQGSVPNMEEESAMEMLEKLLRDPNVAKIGRVDDDMCNLPCPNGNLSHPSPENIFDLKQPQRCGSSDRRYASVYAAMTQTSLPVGKFTIEGSAPEAPSFDRFEPEAGQLTLHWNAPEFLGGAAIEYYEVKFRYKDHTSLGGNKWFCENSGGKLAEYSKKDVLTYADCKSQCADENTNAVGIQCNDVGVQSAAALNAYPFSHAALCEIKNDGDAYPNEEERSHAIVFGEDHEDAKRYRLCRDGDIDSDIFEDSDLDTGYTSKDGVNAGRSTQLTLKYINPDQPYEFQVRAVTALNNSDWSEPFEAQAGAVVAPKGVLDLRVDHRSAQGGSGLTDNSIRLVWNRPQDDGGAHLSLYRVLHVEIDCNTTLEPTYRLEPAKSAIAMATDDVQTGRREHYNKYTVVRGDKTVDLTSTKYVVDPAASQSVTLTKNITAGKKYRFQIIAVNSYGMSSEPVVRSWYTEESPDQIFVNSESKAVSFESASSADASKWRADRVPGTRRRLVSDLLLDPSADSSQLCIKKSTRWECDSLPAAMHLAMGSPKSAPCPAGLSWNETTTVCEASSDAYESEYGKTGREVMLQAGYHRASDIKIQVDRMKIIGEDSDNAEKTIVTCGHYDNATLIRADRGRCFSSAADAYNVAGSEKRQVFLSYLAHLTLMPVRRSLAVEDISDSPSWGGALLVNGVEQPITLENLVMVNFAAKQFGGAILFMDMHQTTLVNLNGCIFVGCYSGAAAQAGASSGEAYGGAIAVVNAKISVKDTTFDSSQSDLGGAVSVTSHAFFQNALHNSRHLMGNYLTELRVSDGTTFYDNKARLSGGAIFAGEGTLHVDGGTRFGDVFEKDGSCASKVAPRQTAYGSTCKMEALHKDMVDRDSGDASGGQLTDVIAEDNRVKVVREQRSDMLMTLGNMTVSAKGITDAARTLNYRKSSMDATLPKLASKLEEIKTMLGTQNDCEKLAGNDLVELRRLVYDFAGSNSEGVLGMNPSRGLDLGVFTEAARDLIGHVAVLKTAHEENPSKITAETVNTTRAVDITGAFESIEAYNASVWLAYYAYETYEDTVTLDRFDWLENTASALLNASTWIARQQETVQSKAEEIRAIVKNSNITTSCDRLQGLILSAQEALVSQSSSDTSFFGNVENDPVLVRDCVPVVDHIADLPGYLATCSAPAGNAMRAIQEPCMMTKNNTEDCKPQPKCSDRLGDGSNDRVTCTEMDMFSRDPNTRCVSCFNNGAECCGIITKTCVDRHGNESNIVVQCDGMDTKPGSPVCVDCVDNGAECCANYTRPNASCASCDFAGGNSWCWNKMGGGPNCAASNLDAAALASAASMAITGGAAGTHTGATPTARKRHWVGR